MTNTPTPTYGTLLSADITVPNADELRDFYKEVVGWEAEPLELHDEEGTYSDYVMKDSAGNWVSGICHKRGANKDLPSQWIVYVTVESIEVSIERCLSLNGCVLKKSLNEDGTIQYALIQDPAGAVLALTKAA